MKVSILLLLSFLSISVFSQTEAANTPSVSSVKKRGNFYFLWGYTRAKYSKSTIQFKDRSNTYYPATGRYHDYDFTIYEATAKDRPDFEDISDVANITIPQFVARIGYYFNNKQDFGKDITIKPIRNSKLNLNLINLSPKESILLNLRLLLLNYLNILFFLP